MSAPAEGCNYFVFLFDVDSRQVDLSLPQTPHFAYGGSAIVNDS
jgi:hypothetical protein